MRSLSRFDPTVTRSAIVFGVFLMLLGLGLHALYRSPTVEQGPDPALLVWLFLGTGAALWLGRPGAVALLDIIVAPIRRFGLRALMIFVVLALIAFLIVARCVLDAFPNSGDEFAYLLQAQTYAEGRLWATPPPDAEAFRQIRFFDMGDKWISQYAPGWAMVLAPFAALGLPLWIVNPLIGAASLAAYFFLARRYVGRETAWIGVLLLGVSSFFILNSSSYFSHSVTALYGVVFALFGSRYIARREIWCAVAAGACIGLMGLTRTQDAMIFATPFAIALAITPERRIGLFWFGLGGLPFLAALLAFNDMVTGNPLLAVQDWRGDEPFTAPSVTTIKMAWGHLVRLYIWTSPVLLFGFVIAFVTAQRRRCLGFSDWILPITVIAFLLYRNDGGNQYGPRYYFGAWPLGVLTILKVIDPILFGAKRGVSASWICSALIASLVFEIGYLPVRLEREHLVVQQRQDMYIQAQSAGLDHALVIVASPSGVIRPMIPADLVRNGLHVGEQKIIYALDLGARNTMLRAQFPGRSWYVYSNGRLEAAR
jgi:TM2 domain-containing membrane protein YozV